MINIITDSTADLGQSLAKEFGICIVPLSVHINGSCFLDGINLTSPQLFELVQHGGKLPTTAAPSIGEFKRAFSNAEENIYIGISSRLSASCQNAMLAAREFPANQVKVIDSLNLSAGIALLVLKAAELCKQGYSCSQIEQLILAAVPKVRCSFFVETMDYLYKGGRCNAVQSIMGSMLKIRPVIEVKPDGTMGVKEKTRGTRKKALKAMLDSFEADLSGLDLRRVFITHAACLEDANYLAEEVNRRAAPQETLITEAGSVISSHCGPQTIGIMYMLK